MRKLFLLISVLSIICISTICCHSAQYWAKTYGESDYCNDNMGECYNYVIKSIQQTTDGGYILAGYKAVCIWPNEDYYTDIWVMKIDSNGDVSWQKTYDGSKLDGASSIQQTTDGGYIVVGTNFLDTGGPTFSVLKLDNSGNITWQKAYMGSIDSIYSIHQTTDGGYVMAGYTQSFGVSGDFWVWKLDNSGNVTWQKTYGGSGFDEASSIQQTTDGGYIVAGHTWSFGVGYRDFWVLKLDGNGNVTWQKTYGGYGEEQAYSIQQTTDGGYIVAGFTRSFGPCCNNNFWVLKLNGNGGVSWQKVYGQSTALTNYSNSAYSILQTMDGGYIVTGFAELYSDVENDIMVLKLDSSGNITWQKRYWESNSDFAYCIQQTTDGGYIVAGYTMSFSDGYGDRALVLKLNNNGDIPNCGIIGTSDAIVSDTNVEGQDSNATIQSTSATITETNIIPHDSSAEITTICEGDYCSIEQIYGEHSEETDLLRHFRDNVLTKTPEGQEIIKLYYQWSPAIVKAMEEDEGFKAELKEVIDGILPLIKIQVD